MKLRLKHGLVLLIILSISMTSSPTTVSGYGGSVHDKIFDEAKEVLADDYSTAANSYTTAYMNRIKQASADADNSGLPGILYIIDAQTHYMGADSHLGVVPGIESAGSFASKNWRYAIQYAQVGDYYNAYYFLGVVLHVLGDMTIPFHATNRFNDGHAAYEGRINSEINTAISKYGQYGYGGEGLYAGTWNFYSYHENAGKPVYDTCDGYSHPIGGSDHCNPNTIFGWMDYGAHVSWKYIDEVACMEFLGMCGYWDWFRFVQQDPAGWNNAIDHLVCFAIDLTAGLMKMFYDTIQTAGKIEYNYFGSTSSSSNYQKSGTVYNLPLSEHQIILSADRSLYWDMCLKWDGTASWDSCDVYFSPSYYIRRTQSETRSGSLSYIIRSSGSAGSFEFFVLNGIDTYISSGSTTYLDQPNENSGYTRTAVTYNAWIFMNGPSGSDIDLAAAWGRTASRYDKDVGSNAGNSLEHVNLAGTGTYLSFNIYRYSGAGTASFYVIEFAPP